MRTTSRRVEAVTEWPTHTQNSEWRAVERAAVPQPLGADFLFLLYPSFLLLFYSFIPVLASHFFSVMFLVFSICLFLNVALFISWTLALNVACFILSVLLGRIHSFWRLLRGHCVRSAGEYFTHKIFELE